MENKNNKTGNPCRRAASSDLQQNGKDFGQGDNDCPVSTVESPTEDKSKANGQEMAISRYSKYTLPKEAVPIHGVNSIQDLPNHLLKRIFSFLGFRQRFRVESVCRKWRLVGRVLPWPDPKELVFTRNREMSSFDIPSTNLTDNILLSLLSRCGSCLKRLTLTFEDGDYVLLTRKSVTTIGLYCQNLEAIKLHVPEINNACLKMLASGCHKLKSVNVFNFGNDDYREGILAIVRGCELLESLVVYGQCLADDLFDIVNPKLKKLSIARSPLPPIAMRNLIVNCNALQELHLCFFSQNLGIDSFTLMDVVSRYRATLRSLKIIMLDGEPDDIVWFHGLMLLRHLKELSLCFCLSVDDDVMDVIVKQCGRVEVLEIPGSSVSDQGVALLTMLPRLKALNVSCTGICGRGLKVLARCGLLEEVQMRLMPNVTEDTCCFLARNLPNLRLLDVSGTNQVTNRTIKAFRVTAKKNFRKEPVKLIVGQTSILNTVATCDGLVVEFTSPYGQFVPDGTPDEEET